MINRTNRHRCLVRTRPHQSFNPFFDIASNDSRVIPITEFIQQSRHYSRLSTTLPSTTRSNTPLRRTPLPSNTNDSTWISWFPALSPFYSSVSFLPRQYYSTVTIEPSLPSSINFNTHSPETLHVGCEVLGSSASSSLPFDASVVIPVPSVPGKLTDSSSSFSFINEASSSIDPLLVVIDLDETLFFSHLNPQSPHDFSISIDRQEIFVSLRPGCKEFLEWCSQNFHTGLYTAGTESYAQALMEKIDPEERLVKKANHRYRQSCWPVHYEVRVNHKSVVQTLYTKDLSLFRKDLSRVVLIDNSLFSFMLQPDNGIPIADWRGQTPSTPATVESTSEKIHDMNTPVSISPTSASGRDSILAKEKKDGETGEDIQREKTAMKTLEPNTKEQNIKEAVFIQSISKMNENHEGNKFRIEDESTKQHSSIEVEHQVKNQDNHLSTVTPSTQSEIEEKEIKRFGDFYWIKKTLEELKDEEDVKPILRSKYRLVDHIIRRCISGMITSNRV